MTWANHTGSVQTRLHKATGKMLIQSAITRWNSELVMLSHFLAVYSKLSVMVMEIKDPSRPELPTLQELDVLREAAKLLDCSKEATVQLSSENSVSISLVIQGFKICLNETPVLTPTRRTSITPCPRFWTLVIKTNFTHLSLFTYILVGYSMP